jgi:DNA primase
MSIQEQVLLTELNKVILSNYKKDNKQASLPEELPLLDETPVDGVPNESREEFSLFFQEKDLIRLLLNYGEKPIDIVVTNEDGHDETHQVSVAEYLIANIEQDEIELQHATYSSIYKEYVEFIGKEEIPSSNSFTQHNDQTISTESSAMLISPHSMSENWSTRHQIYPETEEMLLRKAAKDCVFRLKLRRVEFIREILLKDLKDAGNDIEKTDALQREKILLDKTLAEIAKYFGTVITS